jgi:hypothetical protein
VSQDRLLHQLRDFPGWHEATDNLRERYRIDGEAARSRADAYAECYRGRRAAMVFDVVLSRQRQYTRVEELTEQFAKTRPGTSLKALARHGPGDGYPLRGGEAATMQAVAAGLLRFCRTHGLEEEPGVRRWAEEAGPFELAPRLEPFVGATPGIGPALFAYLRMRSGADALKPDRRVHQALRRVGYQLPRDPHAILLLAQGAALELGIGLLVLDQLLWWVT